MRLLLGAAWLAVVLTLYLVLIHYSNRPAPQPRLPERWPGPEAIALDPTRFTLLLFAHPRCACTRATIRELERALARAGQRWQAHVLVLGEPSLGEEWSRTELRAAAAALPGALVHDDPQARIARLFGARTSGLVAVYAPTGELLFQGGVTPARGHEGDNPGARSVAALLRGELAEAHANAVFGCGLFADAPARPEDGVRHE